MLTCERLRMVDGDGKRIWWMVWEKNIEENNWYDRDHGDVTRNKNRRNRRNWLDMPTEVMNLIFMKLGTVWILGVSQHVCSDWRKLSKQPILYRSVVIHERDLRLFHAIFNNRISVGSLARLAFDRSGGQTLQFSCSDMQYFYPEHLEYIAESSSAVSLKSLRLGKCKQMGIDQLTSIIKKFTSLEELYLFDSWDIPKHVIVEIGHAYRKLKYLRIGNLDFSAADMAFVVAENMPGLRRLHLNGNSLTVHGFQDILNGCPRLEYLRLRGTSNLSDVDVGSLKKQFTRISNIRILNKGHRFRRKFDEYEFDIEKTGARQASLESSSLTKADSDVSDYTVSFYKAPFQDEHDIEAYYE